MNGLRIGSLLLGVAFACTHPPEPPGAGADAGTPGAGPVRAEWPPPATLGGDRPAAVRVPASYDGWTALPAVLLLGGYDYFSKDLDDWIRLSTRVDTQHFLLVMPDGLVDSDGSPYWNATDTCCDYDGTGVDDVGYLRGLVAELQRRFAVDPTRIGLVGHSAGGFMAYRLACEDAPVNALVSIAGSEFLAESKCHATRGVSVLQVHGSADDVMPFAGDDEAPGAREVLRRWAVRDGCTDGWAEEPAKREYLDDRRANETTVGRHGGCSGGFDVELWSLAGADHYPDFRPAFTDDALQWLWTHPRRP